MKPCEINYHLDNCIVNQMINELGWKKFLKAVEAEREKAAGLLTWEACFYLAIHNYFSKQLKKL